MTGIPRDFQPLVRNSGSGWVLFGRVNLEDIYTFLRLLRSRSLRTCSMIYRHLSLSYRRGRRHMDLWDRFSVYIDRYVIHQLLVIFVLCQRTQDKCLVYALTEKERCNKRSKDWGLNLSEQSTWQHVQKTRTKWLNYCWWEISDCF